MLESTAYTPKEIRATGRDELFRALPVTIVSGAGVLDVGTVLGKITASGKFTAYSNAASNGSEVALGILTEKVDATSRDVETSAYVMGVFVEANLTGLDSAAKTDFGSKSFWDGSIRI